MARDTKRVDRPGRALSYGCGYRRCDECYMSVAPKPRKPRVKKLTSPVISQETIDALMRRGTADLPELLSMDTLIDTDPDTVYAKDTYLDNDVYVEPATTYKRK